MRVSANEGDGKGPELESHAAPGQQDTSLGKASTGLTLILTRGSAGQSEKTEKRGGKKRRRGRKVRRLVRDAARIVRERRQGRLVMGAT